jgi:hypothetical protein
VTVSQNSLAFRDLDTSEECFAKGKKKILPFGLVCCFLLIRPEVIDLGKEKPQK